jgi:hypothetical protein
MKRIFLLAAIAFALSANAAPPVEVVPGEVPHRFSCGVTAQAASLLECQALTAGRTYYITDVVAQSSTGTAGTFAIQSGTGTNCGTTTTAVFPAPPMTTSARFASPPNTSAPFVVAFTTPIKVTAGHAICAIGVGTNTLNLQISGFYLPP